MFNYIGTLNKPTAVNKSITCSFTDSYPNLNVIVAKGSYLEIFKVKNENLELIISHNIFGNIIILEKIIENKSIATDNLFILNDTLDYCILKYDIENKKLNIITKGEIREDICKIRNDILYSLDNEYKFIILSPYKNIFRVIFLNSVSRQNNQDFKINMNYDDILYLFNLNKNFSLKEFETFLQENNYKKSDFAFDFKNMENILNTNSYGYKNLLGIGNRQLFEVIKQNDVSKTEKKTSISYYNNSKTTVVRNLTNSCSDLFALVRISNSYSNDNSNLNINNPTNYADLINQNREKQVITLEPFLIDFQNKDLKKIFKISFKLDSLKDSNFMFSPLIGGVVIFYSDVIEYYEILSKKIKKCNNIIKNNYLKTPFPIFEDYTIIDLYNYILYNKEGEMYLFNMNIINKNNNLSKSQQNGYEFYLVPLGSLNYISSINYTQNNMFFIGSDKSNSYYVKFNDVYSNEYLNNLNGIVNTYSEHNLSNNINEIQLEKYSSFYNYNIKNKFKHDKDYFTILEKYENLAPITNFLVLNDSNDRNHFTDINTEIICVCGVGKYTSIKSIKKGRNYIQEAEIPFVLGNIFFSIEVNLEINYSNHYSDFSTILHDNRYKIVDDYSVLKQTNNYNSSEMIIDDEYSTGGVNKSDNLPKQILFFVW